MNTVELTRETFGSTVEKPGIVLVDFWAAWCGPCRSFAPIFEAAAAKHGDLTFAKVDTDKEQEIAGALQIRSIPTVMAFKDGVLVFAQPGMLPPAALEELVTKLRDLDMEDVKRKLEESSSKKD